MSANAEIKNALCEVSAEKWKQFFKETFEEPLVRKLISDLSIPAETIRAQLKQTENILNILLTLRNK